MIQADDAPLVIDDDDRILHVLKYGLISERIEFDNLFTQQQPGVDRQHPRQDQGHGRYRFGPDTEIISDDGNDRRHRCADDEEQSAAVCRRDRRTVQ